MVTGELAMLQIVRTQWGTLPQEQDRAGIQTQAQRASPNPKRPHSEGAGLLLELFQHQGRLERELGFRPGFLQPPTHPRSPGSITSAHYTADARFLIKGLAYGVKTPLPSPTLAPPSWAA